MAFQKKILYDLFGAVRIILIPFIPLYYLLLRLNRMIARPRCAGLPVICVGNITTGGTGKTPAVIHIAEMLKGLGYSPAVVSRGYGGSRTKTGAVVTDGERILLTQEEAGDEAFMMALDLRGVPVAVGKNRLESVERLRQDFNIDIIVMDDGLQNYTIDKDISVAVIDATNPFGNGLLLPAGDLREPVSSLKRSDIVLLNKSDLADDRRLISLIKKIKKAAPAVKIFNSRYKIASLLRINDINYKEGIESLAGKRVLAAAAIGNPGAFFKMIESCKPAIMEAIAFPDHYRFRGSDVERLSGRSTGYDYVIMTEKDFVKLRGHSVNDKFFFLKIGIEISNNDIFKNYFI